MHRDYLCARLEGDVHNKRQRDRGTGSVEVQDIFANLTREKRDERQLESGRGKSVRTVSAATVLSVPIVTVLVVKGYSYRLFHLQE